MYSVLRGCSFLREGNSKLDGAHQSEFMPGIWQSTAVAWAKMATMLSRVITLAESLGRLNGPKVRQVRFLSFVHRNRALGNYFHERAKYRENRNDKFCWETEKRERNECEWDKDDRHIKL